MPFQARSLWVRATSPRRWTTAVGAADRLGLRRCHDGVGGVIVVHKLDEAGIDVPVVIAANVLTGKPIRRRWCQSGFGIIG